jgi:hypothetical protein
MEKPASVAALEVYPQIFSRRLACALLTSRTACFSSLGPRVRKRQLLAMN